MDPTTSGAAPAQGPEPDVRRGTAAGSRAGTGSVLVVIPTYQEADNVEDIVGRTLLAVPDVEVLVVDDASPDGTGALAEALAAVDPRVHVLHRPAKDGLGSAYRAGFAWALARAYTVVVEMDADGSHLPEQLPRLLAALPEADLVLGSRWVPGGRVENWPRSREVLSRGGNRYVRAALGIPLHDATGGYRAFRRSTLEAVDLPTVASQGYCFQVDLAWRTVSAGLRVVEVPITFVERRLGASKMSGAIVREALWRVTAWGLSRRVAGWRPGIPGGIPARRHRPGTASALPAESERAG